MKKIRKICMGIFLFMGIIFMTNVYKVEASELSNEIDLTECITELQELSEVEPLAMYDYVRLISYSTKIDNSSSNINAHFVTYTITCELKQQTSIGGVTSWEKVNKTFSVKIKPFD